jgi:hypothetical protein
LKPLERLILRFSVLFVSLFVISLPFPYHFIPDIGKRTSPYFEIAVKWVGNNIFHIKGAYTSQIVSDSTGMYINLFLISVIAIALSFLWRLFEKQERDYNRLKYWFHTIISYYLSLQLLIYGFDKLFKHQFYLPEPNTLYTPLGNLSPDILYWSTMGSSYYYSVFMGLLEVIPAALLLFQRTRLIGAVIALAVMINVIVINFSYDISVKVYSCFLLLLCFMVALPGLKKIFHLLVLNKPVDGRQWKPEINSQKKILFYSISKAIVIGCILFESLLTYARSDNFNDDRAPRPFLYGAYNVEVFARNNDTIAPLLTNNERLRRVFIHRRGYFITQNMNDEMHDYKMDYDLSKKELILTTTDNSKIILKYVLSGKDSILNLSSEIKNQHINITARKIDLSKLPLLQQGFHWTIDSYGKE